VRASDVTDWEDVRRKIEAAFALGNGLTTDPIEGVVHIDNQASPWYSLVQVRATDRAGVLHRVASALARAQAQIHLATVRTIDGVAVDEFAVTGPTGHKLDADGERMLRIAFEGRSPRPKRSLLGRRRPLDPTEPQNTVVT
jgi:UTP:GlnB (protein PII) uridylyltransferase